MDAVVDANVLFAALIRDGLTRELLLAKDARLFIPEFILEEFMEHRSEILQKTKRENYELDMVFGMLRSVLIIVPKRDFSHFLADARAISPDPDDVPYLALALALGIPVWSNDVRLKAQTKVEILTTKDMLARDGVSKSV